MREVSGISDVGAINTTARVLGGRGHTAITCLRTNTRRAGEYWQSHPDGGDLSRSKRSRRHGPRSGIRRVSQTLLLTLSLLFHEWGFPINDLLYPEQV